MKHYPSKGDTGCSQRPNGTWAGKDDPWFEAVGTLDELSSVIGWARAACDDPDDLNATLRQIQRDLLNLGGLAGGWIDPSHVSFDTEKLERDIHQFSDRLGPLTGFILPDGCELAARLHIARTVARRAERCLVRQGAGPGLAGGLKHINRLSDWLYVAARHANRRAGIDEHPWHDDH